MEDISDDEAVEWGVLPHPTPLAHAVPAHHVVECDRVAHRADPQGRPRVKRLRLIRHSQRETIAASSLSSCNRFAALDDDIVLRHSEADLVPFAAECRIQQGGGCGPHGHSRTVRSFLLKTIPVTVATRNPWQVIRGTHSLSWKSLPIWLRLERQSSEQQPDPWTKLIPEPCLRRSCDEISATFSHVTLQECFEIGIARGHQKQRRGWIRNVDGSCS